MQFLFGFADAKGERLHLEGPVAGLDAQKLDGRDPSEGRKIFSLAYTPKLDLLSGFVPRPGCVLFRDRCSSLTREFGEDVAFALITNQFMVLEAF